MQYFCFSFGNRTHKQLLAFLGHGDVLIQLNCRASDIVMSNSINNEQTAIISFDSISMSIIDALHETFGSQKLSEVCSCQLILKT